MKRFALLSGLLLLAAPFAFSAGFGLYEGSSRGNALGGLTAQADDASAIYYNAAGMTQLEGRHFMGGVTLIVPEGDVELFNTAYDGSSFTGTYADNIFPPPHIYYTHQINEKLWLGAGFYSRFGLASEFDDPENWYGRYSNTNTIVETVSASGHAAWKLSEQVSVAFGIVYTYVDAEFNQAIDANQFLFNEYNDPTTSDFDVFQLLQGDDTGYGFNLAAHFTPNEKWRFGVMFNSEVEIKVDATARFDKPAGLPPTYFVDSNVAADPLDLPFMLMLAGSYKHSDKLEIGFTAIQTGWSSITELGFNYETPFLVIPGVGFELDRVVRELKWKDVWRWSVGFDHKINNKYNFMWGFTLDETPVPDETISYLLPTNDRQLLNLGFGTDLGKWRFEAAYMYLNMSDRDIESRQLEEGVLESNVRDVLAHLLSFTLSRSL
ncbi:MAG: outer membrane protein transport protein [Acidobacteriota bacterium]|nr:outer membrane protein transport protein [Acidobacteriota bacterium]